MSGTLGKASISPVTNSCWCYVHEAEGAMPQDTLKSMQCLGAKHDLHLCSVVLHRSWSNLVVEHMPDMIGFSGCETRSCIMPTAHLI